MNPETESGDVRNGATSEAQYRGRWRWDATTWGTHCLNCLAPCPYRVYVRDGEVQFEEPAGVIPQIRPDVPDMNPLGCQKGSAWSVQLNGPDRVLHPLRRTGERGSGSWERVSWDEALTDVAEAVLDAIDEEGCESVVIEESVEGGLVTMAAPLRFASRIGAVTLDANGLINDFLSGQHITFGKFTCASTVDDTFHTRLVLLWHSNPAYTSIPYFHYVTEARYAGAEVVAIAPDVNASAVHADVHVPIVPGTDAALALAMCRVIVDEGLVDEAFVVAQTDMPLLVVADTGRFLREGDVVAGGAEDRFYLWDPQDGLTPAPAGSLKLERAPALSGRWTARLEDGTDVEVTTVFDLLKAHLEEYAPENVSATCGVHPDVIRDLARKAASRPTKILEGFNAAKYYHGDLMERAMCLLLGLTGNWGRPGTGIQGLALAGLDGYFLFPMKTKRGIDETFRLLDGIAAAADSVRATDPDATDEIAGNHLMQMAVAGGTSTPPAFFNYYHAGYRDIWNRKEWSDPSMRRSFDDYFREAVQRGWWGGLLRPDSATDPQVLIACGTNPLRRARGGRARLLGDLWPKLQLVVTIDVRMSATALHSDIVLPAAMQYERVNVQYPVTHTFMVGFSDAATPPRGEAKTEWEIFALLLEKIEKVAAERGMVEFLDGKRQPRRLDSIASGFTLDGVFAADEVVVDEWIRDSAEAGTLPEGTSIETLRKKGTVRSTGLGAFAPGLGVAGDVVDDAPLVAFQWHVEKGVPFPTLTRRAQFYIDHPWFLEAGEGLPCHKDPPKMGGDLPFLVTSGHSRWTVHAVSMGNRLLLETHRGQPLVILHDGDAESRGIADGDEVRVFNDQGSFRAMVRVTPRVRPSQLILYNGFEPHMFPDWQGGNEVEPGMVKWLHLVSRYGHLRYLPFGWQPVPSDRAVFVDVALSAGGTDA